MWYDLVSNDQVLCLVNKQKIMIGTIKTRKLQWPVYTLRHDSPIKVVKLKELYQENKVRDDLEQTLHRRYVSTGTKIYRY